MSSSPPTPRRSLVAIAVLVVVALLSLAPFAIFPEKRLNADIELLLPKNKWLASEMEFLRDSGAGASVAVSITAKTAAGARELPEIAASFAERIRNAPSIEKVEWRASPESTATAIASILARYPQVLTRDDLKTLERMLTPDAVERALLKRKVELARPGGVFKRGMIATDPLGIRMIATRKIESALFGGGLSVVPSPEALWSGDGQSVLVVLETTAAPSDSSASKTLYRHIHEALGASLPKTGYEVLVVSAHRHAIENERLLKRDIVVTMSVAAFGFFLLFLVFFRNWKAIFVFATPVLGMCCAIGASWLVFPNPSAIILGLGATVIGISLDYGIHVFVVAGRSEVPFEAVRNVTRPLVASALTTLGVFWAFFFSSAPGYHQLAFASTVGVGASLMISLFCLPVILRGKRSGKAPNHISWLEWDGAFAVTTTRARHIVLSATILLLATALLSASVVKWNFDMRGLDAGGAGLLRDENTFRSLWGIGAPAALVIQAKSLEDAMETQDEFAVFAEKHHLPKFRSLSLIWPSLKTRKANAAAWDEFWSHGRKDKTRRLLKDKGVVLSFSPSAFNPFFRNLTAHDFSINLFGGAGFQQLAKRYVIKNTPNEPTVVASYFDDTPEAVKIAFEFATNHPGARIISPKRFGERLSRLVLRDARGAGVAAIALVLLLAFVCLCGARPVAMSLLPVVFGAVAVFPAHLLAGMSLNAMSLVASIVVAGLAIDYGIFAVTALERKNREFSHDAFMALTLSMLTTLVGAGALLWAAHPALRTVGLVVCAGVGAAYASAVWVVPAIGTIACGPRKN